MSAVVFGQEHSYYAVTEKDGSFPAARPEGRAQAQGLA